MNAGTWRINKQSKSKLPIFHSIRLLVFPRGSWWEPLHCMQSADRNFHYWLRLDLRKSKSRHGQLVLLLRIAPLLFSINFVGLDLDILKPSCRTDVSCYRHQAGLVTLHLGLSWNLIWVLDVSWRSVSLTGLTHPRDCSDSNLAELQVSLFDWHSTIVQ